MPDAIITSTASTFGTISGVFSADQSTISGTISGVIPGTLTGSVGVPGPAGAAGAPGQGVPVGGTAGQYLQKIDGTNYNTDWVTLNLGNYALLSGADFTGRVSVPSITGDEVVVIPGFNIVPTQTEPTDKVAGDLWIYDDVGLTPSKLRVFLESETQNIATESWVTTSFAPKASPVFTGDPRAPTPASGDNDTSIATTAFVKVQGYITSAALTGYAPLASPVFTGNPTAPTPTFGDNDTSISTTAFVQAALAGGTAVAKNLEVEVRNQSGSTIPAGSIVYISGATGNKPLITLAQANNDANSAQTMGFVKTSIANNGTGFVIVRGELENIDTSSLTEGVQLYLSPTTAGTWTTTKPSAPQHLVYVGIVIRAHPTHGTILVAVQNGYELGEIHDVALGTLANNDLLAYESSTDLWKNKTAATLGLAAINSQAFTGTPSLPTGTIGVTQTAGNNTTALATTAFVTAAVPAFAAVTAVINNPTSTTTSVNPFTLVNGLCNPNVRNLCIMTATAVSGSGASGGSTVAASGIREMYTNAVSSAGRSGFYFGKTDVTPGYNNSNWRLINWSKKVIVSGRAMMGSTDYSTNYNGDSNTVCRILLGGRAATVTTGNMTQKGISLFKVGGNATAVQLQVHDGTTATTVASSFTPATGEAFSWTLYSDGAGNVTLYINGSSVATSTAGPTGNSTAYYTQYGEQVEATASAAVRQILYCFGGQLYIET